MAGNINTPSILWVAGETTGYNSSGVTPVAVSGYEVALSAASNAYSNAAVAALQARLVASGVLPY